MARLLEVLVLKSYFEVNFKVKLFLKGYFGYF